VVSIVNNVAKSWPWPYFELRMTVPMVSVRLKPDRQLLYELPYKEDILRTFRSAVYRYVCTIPRTQNDYIPLQHSLICLYKREIKPLETKHNLQCSVSIPFCMTTWLHHFNSCTLSGSISQKPIRKNFLTGSTRTRKTKI